jgi:hypothetical protein
LKRHELHCKYFIALTRIYPGRISDTKITGAVATTGAGKLVLLGGNIKLLRLLFAIKTIKPDESFVSWLGENYGGLLNAVLTAVAILSYVVNY